MTATTTDFSTLTGTYTLDVAHSRLGFVARHAMVTKVRGAFNSFEGTATIDGAKPSNSSVQITIDVSSVSTGNEQRDGHLHSNDFFDIANHQKITFNSTAIEHDGGNEFKVTGDLTIKGVTKSVTFPLEFTGSAKDPYNNERIGFEGSTVLNRSDYGVSFNAALETGGLLVSEKVTLEFDISAIKNV
jgi:polyisoprenoid-binding protein YceI